MATGLPDRHNGVLLGLAAGDRNGGPIRLALRLAASLAELGTFDATDVLSRYVAWWREGAFDTGPVAAEVLRRVAIGEDREDAVLSVHRKLGGKTTGCNPAHRSSPLAMAGFLPDERLPELAFLEAQLTHWDPLAGDVASAVVLLCRLLIRGTPWDQAVETTATGRCKETRRAMLETKADALDAGGFAPEVLRAAIFFVDTSASFGEALDRALQFAGKANYSPVLVGTIAGSRWGASQIPGSALQHCGGLLPDIARASAALTVNW